MVANDADVEKANSMNLEARFPYLEDHENSPENLKTAASPRFIKSHLPYRLLPKEVETKKPKVSAHVQFKLFLYMYFQMNNVPGLDSCCPLNGRPTIF